MGEPAPEAPPPWLIRADFPAEATILLRATGVKIGRVLQNFHGRWEAVDNRGASISLHRYRKDAALAVWLNDEIVDASDIDAAVTDG